MPIVKSFAVGAGDMFYIKHGGDSFTIIDCDLCDDNVDAIIADLKLASTGKNLFRFICTHPDEDMESITDSINLTKTTVVFAAHHGRASGKIPDAWLEKLDPQIIVIGEAPSRHLHYYTGYKTITQNRAGDITMDCVGDKVHFYVSNFAARRSKSRQTVTGPLQAWR